MLNGDRRATAGRALWRRLPGRSGPVGPFELLAIRRDPVAWMQRQSERHGPVLGARLLAKPMILLLGPEANEFVLTDPERVFISKPAWSWFLDPILRGGLPLRDAPEHPQHRQILREAFTPETVRQHLGWMQRRIDAAIDRWHRDAGDGDPLPMFPLLKDLMLELAFELLLGAALDADVLPMRRALADCVDAVGATVRFAVPGGRWWRGLRGRKRMEARLRWRLQQGGDDVGTGLLSGLRRARAHGEASLQEQDIVDHLIFLLVSAHHTTTVALSTVLYYLAFHDDWQERCRQHTLMEPDALPLPERPAAPGPLDLVIKECLRLVPPVPALPRVAVRDFDFAGHRLPADTIINVSMAYTHQMPEYWTDPSRFDPHRFAPERQEDRAHRFLFLPFGAGAHACLGGHLAVTQAKAILGGLLRNFRLAHADATYPLRIDRTSLPRPHDDLPLLLQPLG